MKKPALTTVLEALGAGCVVAGVAFMFVPAAFVVAGVLLILFALAAES